MSQGPSTRQSSDAILRRLRSESFGVPPPPAAAAEEGEEFGIEGNTIAATNSQPLGMDTYHTVVRLSIDRSSAACQSLVETHRLAQVVSFSLLGVLCWTGGLLTLDSVWLDSSSALCHSVGDLRQQLRVSPDRQTISFKSFSSRPLFDGLLITVLSEDRPHLVAY